MENSPQRTDEVAAVVRRPLLAVIALLIAALAIVTWRESGDHLAQASVGSQSDDYILVQGVERGAGYIVVFDPQSGKLLFFEDQNDQLRLKGVRPTSDVDQKIYDPTMRGYKNLLEKGNGATVKALKPLVEKHPQPE